MDGEHPQGPWSTRWKIVKRLSRSGQGTTYLVQDTQGGPQGVLKLLNEQKNPERRARIFREASGIRSLTDVPNIAVLLDTNAEKFEEIETDLFLVTRFVEGEHPRGPLPLDDAIRITLSILQTLSLCHKAEILHRDVKPDNIILPKGAPLQAVLIDFGLSFNAIERDEFSTEDGNHLGPRNWFNLPEMAAGSEGQRSAIMDVTHALGVFFQLLTNQRPKQLLDHDGKKPHQRGDAPSLLQAAAGDRARRINEIFDTGFNQSIQARWPSALRLRDVLERLLRGDEQSDPFIDDLKSMADSYRNNPKREIPGRLQHLHEVFKRVMDETIKRFNSSFEGEHKIAPPSISGSPYSGDIFNCSSQLIFVSRVDIQIVANLRVRLVDDAIVSNLSIQHPRKHGVGAQRVTMTAETNIDLPLIKLLDPDPTPTTEEIFRTMVKESMRLLTDFLNNEH